LEHTAKTLTSQHASRDGEHVHVVAGGVAEQPEVVEDGADGHGNGVVHLWHDEGETDGVPVGYVSPVLLGDEEVADDEGKNGGDAKADGGKTRRAADGCRTRKRLVAGGMNT
jgi:hypothetical protein